MFVYTATENSYKARESVILYTLGEERLVVVES